MCHGDLGITHIRQQRSGVRIVTQVRRQFGVQPFVRLAPVIPVAQNFRVQPGPAGKADVLGARLNVPDRGWHLAPRAEQVDLKNTQIGGGPLVLDML